MRALPSLAVAILLTGCVSFLPPHDEGVYKKLETAVAEIDKIGAAVDPPYQPQPGFKEIEPYYIAALASLRSAEAATTSRAEAYRDQMPGRAAELVARAIGNCRKAVETLAQTHRSMGIDGDDFRTSSVPQTCTIPRMMEARLKR